VEITPQEKKKKELKMSKTFFHSSLCLMVAGLLSVAAAQQGGNSSMGSSNQMGSGNQMGSSSLSVADKKFVREAAQGGMAEVELGKLAVQNASSDDVKKFGQRMIDDHTKANDKLKEVASKEGITLPTSLDAKDQATKTRLSKLSRDQFDKAYMKDMVRDHKKDVAAFQNESSTGRDSDVKNFASETLPTLQDHLKEAETIEPKVVQARGTTPSNGMQH
jgi:putative membrane protein